MGLIVQKYGGSSVADIQHIGSVADRILERRAVGHDVVVVVSAMGDTTNALTERAAGVTGDPPRRELDALLATGERASAALLSMALTTRGADAVSLDGAAAGVATDARHGHASIREVDPARLRAELDAGRIPVVTGFQGLGPDGELTTLGRGGSDTSAVALAGALGAERCEICTDVDGVYSADPRVVPDATLLPRIGYTEMAVLARHGAAVLNPRAVEHARAHSVALRVCSSEAPDAAGTAIGPDGDAGAPRAVGVASHNALVPVAINDASGAAASLGDAVVDWLGAPDPFRDRCSRDGQHRALLIDRDAVADLAGLREHAARAFDTRVSIGDERASVSAVGLGAGTDADLVSGSRRDAEGAGLPLYGHFHGDHAVTCVLAAGAEQPAMRLMHERIDAAEVSR